MKIVDLDNREKVQDMILAEVSYECVVHLGTYQAGCKAKSSGNVLCTRISWQVGHL